MADIILPPIIVGESSTTTVAPTVDELTTVALDGTGVFDKLMQTVKLHLQDEYENNRIVGREYSEVYIGAITAVMQQAVAFLVTSRQAEQIEAEISLARQKTVTELAQTCNTIPAGLGFNASTEVLGILALQKALVTSQTSKVNADITDQDRRVTSDIDVNTANITRISTQAVNETNQTNATVSLSTKQESKLDSDILVNDASIDKLEGEQLFIGQKTITELAQTCDNLPVKNVDPANTNPWLNDSSSLEGTLAQQRDLYAAQSEGYEHDARQKLAKLFVDTWSVRQASDGALADPAGLDDSEINAVLNVCRANLDMGQSL